MSHVLIVDDEPGICWGFRRLLTSEGHSVAVASSAEEGLQAARDRRPDAVLLDVRLPGMDGLTAVPRFREICGEASIVMMTAFGSLETAVTALESGAVEYLPKPFELDDAVSLIRRLVHSDESVGATSTGENGLPSSSAAASPDQIVGTSRAFQEVYKQIAIAARSQVPVLISGESGTGKELVARAIHRHSARASRPFLPVSLPALNSALMESELLGHVRGAFVGAEADRPGVFEMAAGGTVLLDEVGEVDVQVQLKLLRILERLEVQRVGDARPRPVDFRVIAATRRDLPNLIRSGEFREDLFYRLSVFRIHLPPLRERRDDIPLLANHFLRASFGEDMPRVRLETIRELCRRDWPGNVRELRNTVERAAIICKGREIGPDDLPQPMEIASIEVSPGEQVQRTTRTWARAVLSGLEVNATLPLHERLMQLVEPELFRETLEAHSGNRSAAAEQLGMHRTTLRHKLRRYGIDSGRQESTGDADG